MKNRLLNFFILCCCVHLSSYAMVSPTYVDSIVMRDGKKIAVDIYIPDGGSGAVYSTVLIQTPYNRQAYRLSGLPLYGSNLSSCPYAYVIADWRGFFGSMAANVNGYDRGKDGYDLVEWIATRSWSNGKIGTWGPSALGKIQFQTAKTQPPHLVCCIPLVASPQFEYREYYPGGVYRTEYVEQLDALGFGLSLVVDPYPTYDLAWQYFIEPSGWYPDSIEVPMFMIGGWYDHGTIPILAMHQALRTSAAVAVRNQQYLMMGPWAHGGFGPVQVGSAQQGELYYYEALGWSDSLARLFFAFYLNGTDSSWYTSVPHVQYFQMGTNVWNAAESWPTADVTPYRLYLHSGGNLNPYVPQSIGDINVLSYDSKDPSPTIGGATLRPDLDQGPYDQAPIVESRSDVLKFSTVVLTQDVVMKGKAVVHLFVSCDRKDTDYAIRLTDVYPDGRSMLLADGIRRLRFRDGYSAADTASAVPGSVYEIVIELADVANTFLTGHSIRVDVSSSNYPRYDCNLNNGLAMYTAGDSLIATSNIYLNPTFASYVELPLVDFVGGMDEGVNEISHLQLVPNPASDEVVVYFNSESNNRMLRVLNNNGACVFEHNLRKGEKSLKIDTNSWPSGMYYLHDGEQSIKFIITH